ncbi:MAG: adenylate/guanylate cyclase domain-containing protein [Geminicoccaceae bacterium]
MRFVLGTVGGGSLPSRVADAIGAQDARSEVLICLVQIAAILTFAVLYALTPKAFPDDVPFEPVPWTLGVYALFTGLRLWLALRRRLGRWFLRVSAVVDVAVLLLTIWSFHLQYQAPAAIYLKAPTLMYVFILIALRALRLEAEFVLITGIAAALGWMILVGYAFASGEARITRNFLDYVTSTAVLLGAEFDKIISIMMVTAVLALALRRARCLLVAAVAEEQAASELSRYFAPEVARRIRATDGAGEGAMRDAAVLITDLRGFTTATANLAPAAIIALIADYHARIVPVIQRHNGSIDKYLGDGILASFGAVRASDHYAADALRAAEAILREGHAWTAARIAAGSPAPGVAVAVATGPVLFGPIGHASRREYTIIGEPVNLAAKLEKHARAESTSGLTTAATIGIARAQGFVPAGVLSARGWRRVSGLATPVDLVAIS